MIWRLPEIRLVRTRCPHGKIPFEHVQTFSFKWSYIDLSYPKTNFAWMGVSKPMGVPNPSEKPPFSDSGIFFKKYQSQKMVVWTPHYVWNPHPSENSLYIYICMYIYICISRLGLAWDSQKVSIKENCQKGTPPDVCINIYIYIYRYRYLV